MNKPRKLSATAEAELQVRGFATRAFKDHVVRSRSERALLLSRKTENGAWDSHYWAELILLRNGLMVYGDIQPVIFGHNAVTGFEEAVAWLSEDLGSSYVAEKAHIGTRPPGRTKLDSARLSYAHAAILRAHELLNKPIVTTPGTIQENVP